MQSARRAQEPTTQGSTEAERGAQFLVRILYRIRYPQKRQRIGSLGLISFVCPQSPQR